MHMSYTQVLQIKICHVFENVSQITFYIFKIFSLKMCAKIARHFIRHAIVVHHVTWHSHHNYQPSKCLFMFLENRNKCVYI